MSADWWLDGHCNTAEHPEAKGIPFFPPDDDETDEVKWYENEGQAAKALCIGCPARVDCFTFALDDPYTIENGVFGGTTPEDRERYLTALSLRR